MEWLTDFTNLCFKSLLESLILPISKPNLKTVVDRLLGRFTLHFQIQLLNIPYRGCEHHKCYQTHPWFHQSWLKQSFPRTYPMCHEQKLILTIKRKSKPSTATRISPPSLFASSSHFGWIPFLKMDWPSIYIIKKNRKRRVTLISRGSSPGKHSSTRLIILVSPSKNNWLFFIINTPKTT